MPLFCMWKQIKIRPGIHGIKIDTTHTSQERIREQIQNDKKPCWESISSQHGFFYEM